MYAFTKTNTKKEHCNTNNYTHLFTSFRYILPFTKSFIRWNISHKCYYTSVTFNARYKLKIILDSFTLKLYLWTTFLKKTFNLLTLVVNWRLILNLFDILWKLYKSNKILNYLCGWYLLSDTEKLQAHFLFPEIPDRLWAHTPFPTMGTVRAFHRDEATGGKAEVQLVSISRKNESILQSPIFTWTISPIFQNYKFFILYQENNQDKVEGLLV